MSHICTITILQRQRKGCRLRPMAQGSLMEPRPLDEKELEVLTGFANGKTTEEIGQALNLHKSIVQDHLRVATRKLGACNRVHAAAIAVEMKLVKIGKRSL